jgi:hypothetical protein
MAADATFTQQMKNAAAPCTIDGWSGSTFAHA